jgi:Fic-DOC domain mobile mystery protein B
MRDLIPAHIAYRRELNEAEQENIARAEEWALSRRRRDLLSEKFIKDLHKHMLGDVWRWAGKFRTSQRNIGIDYWLIPMELRQLLDDSQAWIELGTYPPMKSPCVFITGWSAYTRSRTAMAVMPA